MYINTFRTLPKQLGIAFSGGVDSAVMAHVAMQRGCDVTLYTVDHRDAQSDLEIEFTKLTGKNLQIPVIILDGGDVQNHKVSKESHWSQQRRVAFNNLKGTTIATGHHLNDATEWYLLTAIAGTGGFIMDYRSANVIHPLLMIPKEIIVKYARHHGVQYIEDASNADVTFNQRNRIRHELLPLVLNINPGILNTVRRRIETKNKHNESAPISG